MPPPPVVTSLFALKLKHVSRVHCPRGRPRYQAPKDSVASSIIVNRYSSTTWVIACKSQGCPRMSTGSTATTRRPVWRVAGLPPPTPEGGRREAAVLRGGKRRD